MDPITLAVVGAATVIPVVFGATAIRRAQHRHAEAGRAAWARVAHDRGLLGAAWPTQGRWRVRYGGLLRGRRLTITTPAPIPGWTTVSCELDPPLDLRLRLHAEAWAVRPIPEHGSTESTRARALMSSLRVRSALPALRELRWTADDFAVRIQLPMSFPDAARIDAAIEAGLGMVAAIDAARAEVPLSAIVKEEAEDWKRAAHAAGLASGRLPLSMTGAIDDVAVAAFSFVRPSGGLGLGAHARFRSSLGGAVGLVPTAPGALEPWLELDPSHLAAEDWELGDACFDAAFVVRSREPARLTTILTDTLRKRLLHLHDRTPIYLDDHALRVATTYLLPAGRIPGLLRQLAEVASDIEASVRGRGRGGPYR